MYDSHLQMPNLPLFCALKHFSHILVIFCRSAIFCSAIFHINSCLSSSLLIIWCNSFFSQVYLHNIRTNSGTFGPWHIQFLYCGNKSTDLTGAFIHRIHQWESGVSPAFVSAIHRSAFFLPLFRSDAEPHDISLKCFQHAAIIILMKLVDVDVINS